MTQGFYFRMAYTFAHSIDDGQDALVAGRPATVQNSYSPAERGPSVTDQRHRFVFSAIDEPQPFGRDHAVLSKLFNDWKLSCVLTIGSGRPIDARVQAIRIGRGMTRTTEFQDMDEMRFSGRIMRPRT